MVKLIEQLPGTPELIGDLLIWQPTSYQDYFTASAMPAAPPRPMSMPR
jgi:hypothetical protein